MSVCVFIRTVPHRRQLTYSEKLVTQLSERDGNLDCGPDVHCGWVKGNLGKAEHITATKSGTVYIFLRLYILV